MIDMSVILSQSEARMLTDEVKADAQKLWAKLLSLYEGGAHTALGYSSWADYCQQEFKMGKVRSYQLLNAARVIDQFTMVNSLQVTSQVPESERLARELAPLLGNPQALDEAWNESVEQAGGVPTAHLVREVVARKLTLIPAEKKPLHDLEGIEPSCFKLATRAIGLTSDFRAFVIQADPQAVWAGLKSYERSSFIANCIPIVEWIDFINHLRERENHVLIQRSEQ